MSYFFKSDAQDGAKDTYQKSQIYKHSMAPERDAYDNFIDFLDTEKYLYGRVSYKYVPIEMDTNNMPLASLPAGVTSAASEASSIVAASFVSRAFEELRAAYTKKSLSPGFDKENPHISDLVAAQAYVSPQQLYSQHIKKMQDSILESYRRNKIRFSDFDDFLRKIIPTIKRVTKTMPFTYTGFIKSKYCDPRVSGLVIDLVQGVDFNNDDYKMSLFKNSPNWDFYLNICRSYGFSVDLSNPWRLVADIGSSEMVNYAQQTFGCGFNTTEEILSFGYRPAHITFYENFITYLLNMYTVLKSKYEYPEMCADGTLRSRLVDPPDYTSADISSRFLKTQKLLDLYMDIRLIEDENSYSEGDVKRLKTRIRGAAQMEGPIAAINTFEIFIGQTYDYRGSLTDKINRVKIIKDLEDEDIMMGKLDTHGGPSGGSSGGGY